MASLSGYLAAQPARDGAGQHLDIGVIDHARNRVSITKCYI